MQTGPYCLLINCTQCISIKVYMSNNMSGAEEGMHFWDASLLITRNIHVGVFFFLIREVMKHLIYFVVCCS